MKYCDNLRSEIGQYLLVDYESECVACLDAHAFQDA